MRINRTLNTIEMHTGGEPFRIITNGFPRLAGKTIVERREWIQKHADELRSAMMLEPRGHADMYGGFLTEPVTEGADFGIIFTQNKDYSPHCGHGTIALATAAVELGWIERTSPETRVGIDAPCGFLEAFVQWDGENAGNVRFVNVPSFVWKKDVIVNTPTFGPVSGDIAYGGAFYFYVDGAQYDMAVGESNVDRLKQFGDEITQATNAAFDIVHPEIPEIRGLYGTIISNAPRHPGSTQANCCIFADREVDRSPTGSGTAGRVAQLYQRGTLPSDGTLVNESIIGTIFKGRVLSETKCGEFDAVIPEIEGNAFICGYGTWLIDERDPLTYGFLVR
ncbi:trans-3-hydroxy-L-proline dehydratase [Paraburkholderia phytofirmans]|uniref:Proline racemase n=1 Tax=Paraburkholderia phytofirmans OLGA172 TaxID=1417228 RepID=A0A160FMQ8_9BURK|nr:trans-3-hydroxy-L-proline dehydratase [Paraburkholderia phytofirmans]ANB73792.1 hypothetical protein AYM40_16585 [Paraburkholderia phytofirmans OLGA172]